MTMQTPMAAALKPRPRDAQDQEAEARAILAGLEELEAAEEDGSAVSPVLETETVHVPAYGGDGAPRRPGFSFDIRRLEPEGYETLTKKHTRPGRAGEPAKFDQPTYVCDVIYHATTEPYQEALWDNTARQRRYHAKSNLDLIRILIPKAGDRNEIGNKIDELGGYGRGNGIAYGSSALQQADEALEATLGN